MSLAHSGVQPHDAVLPAGGGLESGEDILSEQSDINTEYRRVWSENSKARPKPTRPLKAAVFMFSWEDSDLETGPEVDSLGKVFEESYNFSVEKISVGNEHPQAQITRDLAGFIFKYDAPGTLLIIYYAGHGWDKGGQDGEFALLGSNNRTRNNKDSHVFIVWTVVEKLLDTAQADVLVIFDCCQAGRLCQYRMPLRFEYLAACGPYEVAQKPGKNSFTAALTWAMEELLNDEGFLVTTLVEKIKEAPNFQDLEDQTPKLGHRLKPGPDHITIAPIPRANSNQQARKVYQPQEYLDVRFHFSRKITLELVAETAKTIDNMCSGKDIKANSASLIKKHTPGPATKFLSVIRTSSLIKKHCSRRREAVKQRAKKGELKPQTPAHGLITPASTTESGTPSCEPSKQGVSTKPAADSTTGILVDTSASPTLNPEADYRKRPALESPRQVQRANKRRRSFQG